MGKHPLPSKWPNAETSQIADTQAFIKNYFEGRIYGNPPPEHRSVGKNSCSSNPSDKKLAPQQAVVNMYLRGIAERGSKHRGFLAWHSTGSGKTCTVLGAIDAFWDTNRSIFLVTSRENAVNNTIAGYSGCASMFPRFKNASDEEVVRMIANRVEERRIMSFTQLAHLLDLYRGVGRAKRDLLQNGVLIMDEVQNLFNPPPGQAKEYTALLDFLEKPSKDNRGLYMVILSATPGRNENEIQRLLTMIRGAPITPDSPLDAFRGLCSFVDYAGDSSVYPVRQPDKFHLVEMSTGQQKVFRTKSKEPDESRGRDRFLYEARRVSNSLSLFKKSASEAAKNLDKYSPKIACIVKEITDHPNEKQYLYSAFNAHGIKYVAMILESKGYTHLSVREDFPTTEAPRFVILGSDAMPVSDTTLRRVMDVFNHKKNATGRFLHIILARKRFNEGLDLKSVRHIHLMEPLLDISAERQAIARAVRHCSHLQLDQKHWTVTVHRYMTIGGVDELVTERAIQENETEGVTKFMRKLREAAIDCRLMSKVHNRDSWMAAGAREAITCPLTRGEEIRKYVKEKGLSLLRKSLELAKRFATSAGQNFKQNVRADFDQIVAIAKTFNVDRKTNKRENEKEFRDGISEVRESIKKIDKIHGYGDMPIRQIVLEGFWLG